MKCEHDCSCCEILCKDAIEAHNNALADHYMYKVKYEELKKEVKRLKAEIEKLKQTKSIN